MSDSTVFCAMNMLRMICSYVTSGTMCFRMILLVIGKNIQD
jgi:hypothetical protein